MREPITWEYVGLCEYERGLELQERRWSERRRGGPDTCLALEHPPTITLGRRAGDDDLRASRQFLASAGIACVAAQRGGRATYHGPGQLVLYPIVGLQERGFGVGEFVSRLEAIMIAIAAAFGVRAWRDERGRGVWAEHGKLGAVGVRIRDGVSSHGLALNVTTDLAPYRWIVPCGMPEAAVTNLVREGAGGATVAAALPVAERACAQLLGGWRGEGWHEGAQL